MSKESFHGYELSQPIAFGRRSEIYDIAFDKVLKLYFMGFPTQQIEQEFANTRVIYNQTELCVPKPLKIIKQANRTGIVFAKIAGSAYGDLFQRNPLLYFTKAAELAQIHARIHSFEVSGVHTQTEAFQNLLVASDRLSAAEKAKLIRILESPHSVRLCHGDFHHGNVMLTDSGEPYILDWMDSFVGDPLLDVALTAVNATVSDAPSHVPYIYRKLYDWLKATLALDQRILSLHPELDRVRLPEYLALAAGIHLVRKSDGDWHGHRAYFERVYQQLACG